MGYRDIFEDLAPDERVHMLQSAEEMHFATGQTIIEQNRPNQSIYIVLDGEVSVHSSGALLAKLGLGSIFGEMAFLTGNTASATIIAAAETTVLRVGHQHIADLIEEKSEFGARFYRSIAATLAVRLKHTSDKIRN